MAAVYTYFLAYYLAGAYNIKARNVEFLPNPCLYVVVLLFAIQDSSARPLPSAMPLQSNNQKRSSAHHPAQSGSWQFKISANPQPASGSSPSPMNVPKQAPVDSCQVTPAAQFTSLSHASMQACGERPPAAYVLTCWLVTPHWRAFSQRQSPPPATLLQLGLGAGSVVVVVVTVVVSTWRSSWS